MKKPSLKITGLGSWNNTRKQKQKEKEEQERNLEPSSLRMATFLITAIAMAAGMSFLPLFPQPLPILIAILVAFVAYTKPQIGMPIGGLVIGLGLMYHLSNLSFISFLGEMQVRVAFIVIWMGLFVALPLFFKRYKSALAIDFGILAVTTLFFAPIYFLAIPLILASAVFFKKYVALSVVYYVLLSVPLQIMQYFKYVVLPITRSDWWLAPGSAPPLLVPLTSISRDLTASMSQFRLYDTSQVIYSIAGQITWVPDWPGRTIKDALTQYLDSVPGILMFVVIVAGLALKLMFFTNLLVKGGLIGAGDKFFQIFTAAIAAAVFFVLVGALQLPLAFKADVSPITMILGIFATVLLTLPVLFIDFTPKQTTNLTELRQKAEELRDKLIVFGAQMQNVKENIPVVVSGPEGKAMVMKDSVEETLRKIHMHNYEQVELDQQFQELAKLGVEKDALEEDVNRILSEYQIFATCELSNWIGKLKEAGLDIKTTMTADYQKEMLLEQRIEAITKILEAGRAVVREVVEVVDPIYGIIRPLYDPTLPEKSRAVEFASQKLATKEAPWIVIEALYSSLNNWSRQYGAEIQSSIKYLKTSLSPIANLSSQSDVLPFVFGDNTSKVLDYAKKAEAMKSEAQKRPEDARVSMLDVIALKNDVLTFLGIANDVLSMLYIGLISEEDQINALLPTKDYLWEQNSTLRERLKKATETLGNPTNYQINQIMENLPRYLSYVDEAVQTLAIYNERKEFLLNYPLAETAITEQLKTKEKLTPKDLPFQPRFASEYLKLYYTQRFGEFTYDKDEQVLTKRTSPI